MRSDSLISAPGLIGEAVSLPYALAGRFQVTIVTLDRGWGTALVGELRQLNLPTLMPASPARWREHFSPDQLNCIIFDLDHGGVGAFEAISDISAQSPLTMILAAATAPAIKTVVQAVRAGAFDFINKRFQLADILNLVQEAGHRLVARQGSAIEEIESRKHVAALTPRERAFIVELSAGLSSKEIARKLGITPRTVQMYRDRVKRRLHANSVEEAVSIWIRCGGKPPLQSVS